MKNVLMIGVGNKDLGDDAVGVMVLDEIKKEDIPYMTVLQHRGEGIDLMDAWKGFDHVVIVDAVSSGGAPGTIHRLDAHQAPLPAQFFNSSTHAFGVSEAVELSRNLNSLPKELVIYGIEGENFHPGQTMSPAVLEAVQFAASQITKEIRGLKYA